MRKNLVILAVLLLSLPSMSTAQEAGTGDERDAVRRAVETYLYAEEPEERMGVINPRAIIYSVDPTCSKMTETPVATPAKKLPKGGKVISRQKIVSMDVTAGGASVKVETDLSSELVKYPKHIQYLALLKLNGEWKIVSILMPPLKSVGTVSR